MSLQLNQVNLAGNLTRDCDYKKLAGDRSVVNVGLAINRTWKDDKGERQQETTFLDLEAWGKPAEFLASYFAKGQPVFVSGRLKLDTWTDRETGKQRSRIKVLVDHASFVESKGDGPVVVTGADDSSPMPAPVAAGKITTETSATATVHDEPPF